MSNTVEFNNTFMHTIVEVGASTTVRGNEVTLIDAFPASLVRVYAGGVCVYMNVATARSLAEQILRVIDNGSDPLWDTEPTTGEEEDRWAEDIRSGAIGGNA